MKLIPISILILLSFSIRAQKVTIVTQTDSIYTEIKAYDESHLSTEMGIVDHWDIQSIIFYSTPKESTIDKLKEFNISYTFSDANPETRLESKGVMVMNDPLTELKTDLGKFNNTRRKGKLVQIIGVGIGIIGILIEQPTLGGVGGAFFIAGWAIESSASKHLKKYETSTN
ncbi:MAG: hypothetical protein JXR07_07700 [Reichenbachiella sp.]